MRPFLFLTVVLVFVALTAGASEQRVAPTIEDLVGLERIGAAELSPDGSKIAYELTEADFGEDTFATQLWLVDTRTKAARQLTRGANSSTSPRWSPDGEWIAFLSERSEDSAQVHLIPPDGGEAFPITTERSGIRDIEWSPGSEAIAFVAEEPQSDAAEARAEYYGEYEVVRADYRFSHLFTVIIDDAMDEPVEGIQRTGGRDFSVGNIAWSPDGTRIAFDAHVDPDLVNLHTADLYVIDLGDDLVSTIVDAVGPDTEPHWSPDGTQIAYATVPNRREYFVYNQEIAIVPAEGGEPRVISESFDENAHPIGWKRDGIYFVAQQKMATHLLRIDAFTGFIERVSEPENLMGASFSLTDDGTAFGFVAGTADSLPDVFVQRAAYALPVALTDMTAQVERLDLARREVVRWKSKDGTEIEGVLHKPRDFNPLREYPLLVVIHGGPQGTDRPALLQGARYYPVDIWTSRGALVLRVNYRGSAGYGEAFRKLNVRNLGVGDAWDVESGVNHLINQGYVDPERIGCMGWSQGGYISAYLTTNSDLFAAVSVGAGISNWATYYYNTDITQFTINYLGADPATDPGIYAKTSPMTNVLRADTPTLIQHGENDGRVPIPNAYELRQGLEDRGVPVEMIVYKGFGHGIDKPRARRAVLQHNLDWFNHHLWGDPYPDWVRPDVPETEEEGDEDE